MNDLNPQFGEPVTGWVRVFAFLPHWTDDYGWRWLQLVYKRRVQGHDYLYPPAGSWWQYRKSHPTNPNLLEEK